MMQLVNYTISKNRSGDLVSTGTWWWVRVLPPPGTLIWRFPGLIRPRRTAGATHRIAGSHYGAELHT
jgi:hypothetical protein